MHSQLDRPDPEREPAPLSTEAALEEALVDLATITADVGRLLDYCDALDRVAAAGEGTLTTGSVRRMLRGPA